MIYTTQIFLQTDRMHKHQEKQSMRNKIIHTFDTAPLQTTEDANDKKTTTVFLDRRAIRHAAFDDRMIDRSVDRLNERLTS